MNKNDSTNELLIPNGSIVEKRRKAKNAKTEQLITTAPYNEHVREELGRRRYKTNIILQWVIILITSISLLFVILTYINKI